MSRSLRYLFAFGVVLTVAFISLGGEARAQAKLGPVVGDAKIIVEPTVRVGQKARVRVEDLPDPGPQDWLMVTPAGTPDNVYHLTPGATVPFYMLVNKTYLVNGWEFGPLPPGLWEVRWLTTLYNSERKLEVGARAQFTVGR